MQSEEKKSKFTFMGEVQPKNTTAERILKRRAEEEAALKAREDAVSLLSKP